MFVKVVPVLYRVKHGKVTFIPVSRHLQMSFAGSQRAAVKDPKPRLLQRMYICRHTPPSPQSGALVPNPHEQKIPVACQVLVLPLSFIDSPGINV